MNGLLGNVVVLVPGRHIRWLRSKQRCPNEATGFYAEDVRSFGFRVIQATPNGFSFTASALSETATNKTYQLTIVDPSEGLTGAFTHAAAPVECGDLSPLSAGDLSPSNAAARTALAKG